MSVARVEDHDGGVDQVHRLMVDLEAAKSVPEISQVVAKAEALREAAKRARVADDQLREIAMISLRAQRRAGELLNTLPRAKRGRPDGKSDTLSELLHTTQQAAQKMAQRWLAVAEVSPEIFEEYLSDHRRLPSRGGLLKYGRPPQPREASHPAAEHEITKITRPEPEERISDLEMAERSLGVILAHIRDDHLYESGGFPSWQSYLASLIGVRLDELAGDEVPS